MSPSRALAAELPGDVSASPRSRLIGWLVSYADDARGVAHEIRTGRAFISGEDLPNNRIITIAERDLSSPHLALNASPRHRVMVQDIFSESGSYLVRGRSGEELPVRGPTEVEHGDWVRVGTHTRFQVCLIDGEAASIQRSAVPKNAVQNAASINTSEGSPSKSTPSQDGPRSASRDGPQNLRQSGSGQRNEKNNRKSSTK